MVIGIFYLHRNPLEWQEPDKFIPDRFDPSSPYYLTPLGKKRNPCSFTPFLGGRRICLGKTFAENIAKIVIASIVHHVDFEFVNKELNEKKPPNGLFAEPQFLVKVTPR
jgi:cytochrome P450